MSISSNSTVLLQTLDLKKSYHETGETLEILRGVDFTLREGESVAIMGSSGAGKSTLLNLLGGLDQPTSGSILFRGENISQYRDGQRDAYRQRHLGFIFQFHHLLPEFTALENVMIPGRIMGRSEEECRAEAMELLKAVGLESRPRHLPSELSGGERQRVAVARALMNKPSLVLADEPSGNLDEANAARLHDLFFDISAQFHQAILVVTHDRKLASLASRQVYMSGGRIVEE